MARYRIVCTNQEPADQPPTHAHIVQVGTGTDPDQASSRWTVSQVVSAIDQGNTFYTRGVISGKTAEVEKYWCSNCRRYFIRSSPDASLDNNLDYLRKCNFK